MAPPRLIERQTKASLNITGDFDGDSMIINVFEMSSESHYTNDNVTCRYINISRAVGTGTTAFSYLLLEFQSYLQKLSST